MKAFVRNVLQKNSCQKAEQEALFTLFQATTYMSDNVDDVARILGISSKYVNQHEIDDKSSFQVLPMSTRSTSQCASLQQQSILEFCHSDESSTINSRSKRMIEVLVDGRTEKHAGRVWSVLTVNQQYCPKRVASWVEQS